MSYHPTSQALGATLTPEQTQALLEVDPKELRALPIERRVELAFLNAEHKVRKQEAFWLAVQGFALGALPVLAFLGVTKLGR